MVKRLALAVFSVWSYSAWSVSCALAPSSDLSRPVTDRLAAAVSGLESACVPKRGSELEAKLALFRQAVAQWKQEQSTQTAIPGQSNWQGLPTTCENFPGFISNQRDEAFRNYQLDLASEPNGFASCFENPIENRGADSNAAFSRCLDATRDEQLRAAADFCGTAKHHGSSSNRQQTLSESYAQMNQNFQDVINLLTPSCTADADRVRESALHTATALAAAFSAVEPVPEAAGMGVAMTASVLNTAMDRLLDKSPATRDVSCALVETVERDLQCNQFSRVPASVESPAGAEALFDSVPTKASSVDAVLNAMERVEDRTNAQVSKPDDIAHGATDLSTHPDLNDLVGLMGMRVPGQTAVLPMADYLKKVAQDLRFAASAWEANGPSETKIQQYLGNDRKHLTSAFVQSIRQMGSDQRRSWEHMGTAIDAMVAQFEEFKKALAAGNSEEIDQKRASLLRTLPREATRDALNEGTSGVFKLVRQAIDRHWQLQVKPDSGIRKLRGFDLSTELDASLSQALSRKNDASMAQAYPLLRDAYAEMLKNKNAQFKLRMNEALRPLEKNPKLFNRQQATKIFETSVEPLLNRCILLANLYVFGTDTSSLSTSGVEEYQQICGPFLCDEIMGEFNFGGGAAPVREKQCKLFSDQKGIGEKLSQRFVAPPTMGKLCQSRPALSTFQKVRRFLRVNPTPTHDSKAERR